MALMRLLLPERFKTSECIVAVATGLSQW